IDRRQLPRLPIWWSSRRCQLTWCSAYSRRAGLSMKRFIGALRLRGESPYAAVARPSVLRGPGPASLLRMVARTSCGHWHRHLVRPATVTGWHWLGWKPFWRWESRTGSAGLGSRGERYRGHLPPGRERRPRRAAPSEQPADGTADEPGRAELQPAHRAPSVGGQRLAVAAADQPAGEPRQE